VNYYDPYGLINPVKMGVGFVNAYRGVKGMGTAVGTFVTGTVAIPFTSGVSGPSAYAIGTAQFAMGFANLNRGVGQMSEAYDESSCQSSSKNLLGLLPFGQKYDDALEPGMGEYFAGIWNNFVTDPIDTAWQATKDFFAFD
jgi:type VI secretion system secreted protein VgrG